MLMIERVASKAIQVNPNLQIKFLVDGLQETYTLWEADDYLCLKTFSETQHLKQVTIQSSQYPMLKTGMISLSKLWIVIFECVQ
jgi:hypothetical protein